MPGPPDFVGPAAVDPEYYGRGGAYAPVEPDSPVPPTLPDIAAAVGALTYGQMLEFGKVLRQFSPEGGFRDDRDMAHALHNWAGTFK
jgi:hypothetical protein